MKKRQALGLEGVPIPALPLTTKVLDKFPLLVEFLTCNAYEDGTPRTPGSWRVENKVIAFQMTLYDADAGVRLPFQAGTLDDLFRGVEKLLGAPDAPWEVDRYLTEQLAKKQKKKK